jgi:uncharacterized membrane protein YdjX (TVP38/TMEM64 family)
MLFPANDPARRRFVLLLALVAACAACDYVWGPHLPRSPEKLRAMVASWGNLGPLVFIAVFVLRPFLIFPSTLLFIAGGLAFGAVKGAVYASIGGVIAGAITFLMARAMGRDFVQARLGSRLDWVDQHRWGVGLVFLLNLIPIVPITGINCGAGLSRIGFGEFMAAVVLGLTPRALAYSFVGSSLLDLHSRAFLAAVVVLAAMLAVPLVFRRRYRSAGKALSF